MSETLDPLVKARVKEALLAQARERRAALTESAAAEAAAAEVDQDSSFSIDDLSQADAAGDFTGLLEESAAAQQECIERIEKLDFGAASIVGPGAVVGFGGQRFVVGVGGVDLECDGVAYQGISTGSPIYRAIDGLALGDSFEFRGRTHRIELLG